MRKPNHLVSGYTLLLHVLEERKKLLMTCVLEDFDVMHFANFDADILFVAMTLHCTCLIVPVLVMG